LEVGITKDGNQASFSQLSKGQRCMLKLCFGVAVMQAVQNHHGLSFNVAMFDEALDGLSDTLKMKAVRMLESLTPTYGSVFLVEHSETVKVLVDNKYNVELVNGASQIEKI
jgi:DNA repair exonuclease SbcCD ATPase subunit